MIVTNDISTGNHYDIPKYSTVASYDNFSDSPHVEHLGSAFAIHSPLSRSVTLSLLS